LKSKKPRRGKGNKSTELYTTKPKKKKKKNKKKKKKKNHPTKNNQKKKKKKKKKEKKKTPPQEPQTDEREPLPAHFWGLGGKKKKHSPSARYIGKT